VARPAPDSSLGVTTGPPKAREVLGRILPPAIIAGVGLALGANRIALVAGLAALVLLLIGLVVPGVARRIDRGIARFGAWIASGVSGAVAAAGWLLLVLPVWAVGSFVPPLRRRRVGERSDGWVRVSTEQRSSFTRTFSRPPSSGGRLLPRFAILVLGVTAGALGAMLWTGGSDSGGGLALGADPVVLRPQVFEPEAKAWALDYAFSEEPWADEMMSNAASTSGRPDPVVGWRGNDLRSTHVNVVGGRRVSWSSPDPTRTVWFFGGSTMFGDGQRDEHTIPSEFARQAAEDGIRIEAVNFGLASYNNYQETLVFVQALEELPPPDLAVFYDGANEWSTALERVNYGEIEPGGIYFQAASEEERAERVSRAPAVTASSEEQFELAVTLGAEQYRRGVGIARAAGAAKGVEVVHIWQPGLWSTPVRPFTQPLLERWQFTPETLEQIRRIMDEMRDRSGVGPIDLGDALVDVERPTFFDPAHTNELGARVIAERMYRELRPRLSG
jgi:hypothetical protein